jgi:copper chaperone CopZ
MNQTTTRTYTVVGMTCGHCVASVTEEVQEVPGVTDVEVVLDSGTLTITSAEPVDDDALGASIKHAVEDAGYQLA